jgi:hypothetical protein
MKKRIALREHLSPGSSARIWPQPNEAGWSKMPRYIAVILRALQKNASKGYDLGAVYLELLARNEEEGIVEIVKEEEHAYLSGYKANARGVRSWRERVRMLEQLGFIEAYPRGVARIDQVIVRHPRHALEALHAAKQLDDELHHYLGKILIDSGAVPDPLSSGPSVAAAAAPPPPAPVTQNPATASESNHHSPQ